MIIYHLKKNAKVNNKIKIYNLTIFNIILNKILECNS